MSYQVSALKVAQDCSALLRDDHFVLAGGDHSDTYLDKNRLLAKPAALEYLVRDLANYWLEEVGSWPEAVIGPAIGGAIIAHHLAGAFTQRTGTMIHSLFSERSTNGDGFGLYRGFDKLARDKRILVVDDVLTSGRSIKSTVAVLEAKRIPVLGAAVLFRRSQVTAEELGVEKLLVLADIPLQNWPADSCPLCERGQPVNQNFGHGRMFAAVTRSEK